jgi:hypothetical protein
VKLLHTEHNKRQQKGLLTARAFWGGFATLPQKPQSVISLCAGRYIHMEFNLEMEKQSFIRVSKAFGFGLVFGVGIVSFLLAIYFLAQDYSNNYFQTKNLFYLITGISCLYLGLRFKRFKN